MSTAFTQATAVPIDGALPPQNTGTAGRALISNGTTAGWNTVLSMIGTGAGQTTPAAAASAILPVQTGQNGKVLSTDGNGNLSWATPSSAVAGVSSISISGTSYTGNVTITNVPSATTASTLSSTLPISLGGTGATSPAGALTALGAAAASHTHNYAPLASPAFTGVPTAPTPATADNSTAIATTAFVTSKLSTGGKSLGSPEARSFGVTYTAATDGFIMGSASIDSTGYSGIGFYIYINGGAYMYRWSPYEEASGQVSGMVPVRAGYTYQLGVTGGSAIGAWWTPLS